jgi:hypothetical protein
MRIGQRRRQTDEWNVTSLHWGSYFFLRILPFVRSDKYVHHNLTPLMLICQFLLSGGNAVFMFMNRTPPPVPPYVHFTDRLACDRLPQTPDESLSDSINQLLYHKGFWRWNQLLLQSCSLWLDESVCITVLSVLLHTNNTPTNSQNPLRNKGLYVSDHITHSFSGWERDALLNHQNTNKSGRS